MKLLTLFGTTCAALAVAALAQGPVQAQDSAAAASSAPATPGAHAKKAPRPARHTAMDLHAPPLTHIYSSQDLRYILAPDEDPNAQEISEVSVKGTRYAAPVPLGQLRAIPWAVVHPTQAWRIFAPVETQ
jgi:hypothetical protein